MKQADFNEIFRIRTKRLAIDTINFVSKIEHSDALSIIRKQLIRSLTSVAANYRATCRARSQREKYSKLCIVVEEADESLLWLEILDETQTVDSEIFNKLKSESLEILKVMSSYKKTLSDKLNQS